MSVDDPTDDDRYPTLSPVGRRMLDFLREHPRAPIYRDRSGNRLLAEDVAAVRAHADAVRAAAVEGTPGQVPGWVGEHLAHVFAEVPFWRRRGGPPARLIDAPTTRRADLARDLAAHVPDDVDAARMINFRTTGTTGHPLLVPSLPRVAASYLAYHQRALARWDVTLAAGAGQVGVVLLGFQRKCFTYVSVTPTLDEAGLAKINLHPADWRDPGDRGPYLEALAAEVIAGDPLSFAALLELDVALTPRAILSTSMALSDGLRDRLVGRFACPVLDLYSLNEAGPVAVFDARAGGHVLLQPRLYVEIVDDDDRPVPPGTRGEVALTGGFNPCLPLVRYRTGDHAALRSSGRELVLDGLSGRRPVRFRTRDGAWANNIDVTHALGRFALARYALHQDAAGAVTLRVRGEGLDRAALAAALVDLLGAGTRVEVAALEDEATPQYASALAGAEP